MDAVKNPYTPGAGIKPLTLAGRNEVINKASILLKRVKNGFPQRSIMLYGLRGVGKTVLLNHFEDLAKKEGYIVQHLEMSESDDFKKVIARTVRKILLNIDSIERAKNALRKAFGVLKSLTLSLPDGSELTIDVDKIMGEGDSGNFESDLVDLVENVGYAAKENNKVICVLIDETQYVDEQSLAALIAASHKISQKNLPVVFICAGLPQIAALTGDAKSYAERLFDFIKINGLGQKETREAIEGPAQSQKVYYEEDAVKYLSHLTSGYPYFIQEFCKFVWDFAPTSPITRSDVEGAVPLAIRSLDESFFKVRLDRATDKEKDLMRAMAKLGSGPYKISDVISKMKTKQNYVSPIRASLIRKGFIYAPQYGMIDFSVPKFDEFLRRHFGI